MMSVRMYPMVAALVALGGLLTICGCEQKSGEAPTPAKPKATVAPEPTAASATQVPTVPLGLPPLKVPDDNPMTAEKIELGKMLYFDKRLSKEKDIACATCHDPKMAWAENTPTSHGIHGQLGDRNSPTVINAAYMPAQFWDGRAATLEEQALGPIENPVEMGNSMEACIDTLAGLPEYQKRFKAIFGTAVTKEGIAKAIAAFERTVLSGNSPYDRLVEKNDKKALTEVQSRGMDVFMSQCSTCHAPPLFSNGNYYNAGVGTGKAKPDIGRKKVTGKDADMGKFRVPGLREVNNTAPYFHDGGTATLEDAVRLMATGGIDNPNLSSALKGVREADLKGQDIKDIVEFLRALSGEYPKTEPPRLP